MVKVKIPPPLPFPTLAQFKTAVNNIVLLNRPWYNVTLGGGEPTIHPHIFELISMLHDKLGERLNRILIISNGSRNKSLYGRIVDLAKSANILILISIHTDHVEMKHILELIENLSSDIELSFALMFNPDKREMVHEIYDNMIDYRKKFQFYMKIDTLRDGDRIDPRYTPEDFAWQKNAIANFAAVARNFNSKFPERKKLKHLIQVFRDIEDNNEVKSVNAGDRNLEFNKGLFQFKNMYCVAHSSVLRIEETGDCRGMVCGADPFIGNIYKEDFFEKIYGKLIHFVKCDRQHCGCSVNDCIPKFASEKDAKKFVEFAQKRQMDLFDEYAGTTPFIRII